MDGFWLVGLVGFDCVYCGCLGLVGLLFSVSLFLWFAIVSVFATSMDQARSRPPLASFCRIPEHSSSRWQKRQSVERSARSVETHWCVLRMDALDGVLCIGSAATYRSYESKAGTSPNGRRLHGIYGGFPFEPSLKPKIFNRSDRHSQQHTHPSL